ncbi:MAG: hypothetical protein QOF15_2763 [Mycobacterium sp.]|jgi:PPE-repeat protein|nr:hypothetical protein [Mycobacterium sp.]
MDYGAFPPEFNSARMYAGPGASPMVAAAAAWDALAGELRSAATSYGSVIETVTSGPWVGPSATAMASAAAPYVAWMSATAAQAETAGMQAKAVAGAFDAAFGMTVPPPVIALNRAQVMMLAATNFFGQNTAAIAALETEYAEMWAQDAAAMYTYAANATTATSSVTPFTAAPETTSSSGLAAQSGAQAAAASTGGVQSTLSQLITAVPNALQSLVSPGASLAAAENPLAGLLGGGSADAVSAGGLFGGIDGGTLVDSVAAQYATYPGLFGLFMGVNALGPLMNPGLWSQLSAQAAATTAAEGAAAAAQGAAQGAAAGFGGFGGMGAIPGLGQAATVGGLSVPAASWGYAANGPAAMLGGMPLGAPIGAVDPNLAAGLGMPMLMGGGGRGAAGAAGSNKYGLPLPSVMTRPPAAGYGPAAGGPSTPAYPVPAGFPVNGQAPPGYQPAIVYVPTNGHAASN